MRFSKMHFRKSKRALWIFTPSEMRLQRVKKTKFLKNELGGKLRTRHSPSRLAAAHFCSFTLWGGLSVFFKNGCFCKKTDGWDLAGRGSDRPKSRVSPGVSRWEGLCWEPKP